MGVHNFLEDEEYEGEDYETSPYGRGFSDVVTGQSNLFPSTVGNNFAGDEDEDEEGGGFVPNFLEDEEFGESDGEEEEFEDDGEIFVGFADDAELNSTSVADASMVGEPTQSIVDSPRSLGSNRQPFTPSIEPKTVIVGPASNAVRGDAESVRSVPNDPVGLDSISKGSKNSNVRSSEVSSTVSSVLAPQRKRRDLSLGSPRVSVPVVPKYPSSLDDSPVAETSSVKSTPVGNRNSVNGSAPKSKIADIEGARESSTIVTKRDVPSIPNFLEEEDYGENDVPAVRVTPVQDIVGSTSSSSSPSPSNSFGKFQEAAKIFAPVAKLPVPTESESIAANKLNSVPKSKPREFTALEHSHSMTRKVGSDGLTKAEKLRVGDSNGLIRTPSNGKLSERELSFFANLGMDGKHSEAKNSAKELLLPKSFEDNKQRLERERRISTAMGSIGSSRSRLTERDRKVVEFIALFKFASQRHIAKLLQIKEMSAYKVLNRLNNFGLVRGFKVIGIDGFVWSLTDTGMLLSGYDLPRGSKAELNLSMIAHQFTVIHVGAHIWSSGVNVLRENRWPVMNRLNSKGEPVYGDQVVSELQIQSAFGKVRGTNKAAAYVPQTKKHMANQFASWERAGGTSFGPSPEFQAGNEYMWTLFPPIANKLNYHVPDLVVARPRGADGSPQSIAVEVELRTKSNEDSYVRTLEAYRTDQNIFKKVVWVCRLKGTAEKINRIAVNNGLIKSGKLTIVPIMEDDGTRLKGRETWGL